MNLSYYKMPIIVQDGMPGKPRWIQIERNLFLILQSTFVIFDIQNQFWRILEQNGISSVKKQKQKKNPTWYPYTT